MKKVLLLLLVFYIVSLDFEANAQCYNPANTYSFSYNTKTYIVVRENLTWVDAAACAASIGEGLARINDQAEQDVIFDELLNNAGIDPNFTIAADGGGAAYVWIGGNDLDTEGVWIWDGDNDGNGDQFWMGDFNGSPVGGLYNNWGDEPDDFNGQDALGIGITDWPFGVAGQWNDVDEDNELYYIIESDLLAVNDLSINQSINLYPNPSKDEVVVSSNNGVRINSVSLFSVTGSHINKWQITGETVTLDVSYYPSGVYFVKVEFANGQTITQKLIKQ